MLSLPPVKTNETGLALKAGIPGLWDALVSIISGTCTDIVCLSLPQHEPKEPVSVPGCSTSTGYFIDRLERQGHGSRLGIGLKGQDFGNPGACLHHYISN